MAATKKKTTAPPPAKKQKKAAAIIDEEDAILDADDDVAIPLAALPPPPVPSEPSTPIQRSYTYASEVPAECSKVDPSNPAIKVPCVLGVDEAGRGPVLGPLVYGIAYCPIAYQDDLKQIGFADSKALTAERRDTLLSALIDHNENLGWSVRVMSPQDISAGMLRRRPINLNAQSSAATVSLIAGVLDKGVDVTEIYVDTVGDPKSYSRLLSSHFPRHPHIKWTVTSKADAIYPIVGAASIAAKVTRDRCIEGWKYAEQRSIPTTASASLEKESAKVLGDATNQQNSTQSSMQENGKKRKAETEAATAQDGVWDQLGALGSGYPGDPNTVAFLKRTLDPVFGWPGIVRFSWATAKTMLEEKVKLPTSKAESTTPALPTLEGGKRLTRSLSRSSSFADTNGAISQDTDASMPAVESKPPTSMYGTLLPQPSVAGGTAPRGYKVKWIDEPVSISKFFGSASVKKPASRAESEAAETIKSGFKVSALQSAVNDWLKNEPQWRAKKNANAAGSTAATKLLKDLGLSNADAAFCLS